MSDSLDTAEATPPPPPPAHGAQSGTLDAVESHASALSDLAASLTTASSSESTLLHEHDDDGEEHALDSHEVIELQAFSERKDWIMDKIQFLETLPPIEVFVGLDAVRSSSLEIPGLPTRAELNRWVVEHDKIEKETEVFDSGDLKKLRKITKAAAHRNLSPEDTDLIELTLTTIYALDKLLHLLRDRSENLDLLGVRLTWEERRIASWTDLNKTVADLQSFVTTKARWSPAVYEAVSVGTPPAQEATLHRRGSIASLSSLASQSSLTGPGFSRSSRFKMAELLTKEAAQHSGRLTTLRHGKINAAGKALDKLIESSRKEVPGELLDEQDKLEDRGITEMENVGKFVMSVVMQWKKADEYYVETLKDEATAQTLINEIEDAQMRHPMARQSANYSLRAATLLKRLASRVDPAQLFLRPTHPLVSDQAASNDSIIRTLCAERMCTLDLASKADAAAKEYADALLAVQRAEALHNDAIDISERFALVADRLQNGMSAGDDDGTAPALTTENCLEPTRHAAFLALLPSVLKDLQEADARAARVLRESVGVLLNLERDGIDPQFRVDVLESTEALAAAREQVKHARDVVNRRVQLLRDIRKVWAVMNDGAKQLDHLHRTIGDAMDRQRWRRQSISDGTPLTPETPIVPLAEVVLTPKEVILQLNVLEHRVEQDVTRPLSPLSPSMEPRLRDFVGQSATGLSSLLSSLRHMNRIWDAVQKQAVTMALVRDESNDLLLRIEDAKSGFDSLIHDVLNSDLAGQPKGDVEIDNLKSRVQAFVGGLSARIPFVNHTEPPAGSPVAMVHRRSSSFGELDLAALRQPITLDLPIDLGELDSVVRTDSNSYAMVLAGELRSVERKAGHLDLARLAKDVDDAVLSVVADIQAAGQDVAALKTSFSAHDPSMALTEHLASVAIQADDLAKVARPRLARSFSPVRGLLHRMESSPSANDPDVREVLIAARRRAVDDAELKLNAWIADVVSFQAQIAEARHAEEVRLEQARIAEEQRVQADKERLEAEECARVERERLEAEERARAELERLERERLEEERRQKEQEERERAEREERERLEREAEERRRKLQEEQERLEREQRERRERLEKEWRERQERLDQEERERKARLDQEEKERKERIEREARQNAERLEREAREKSEREQREATERLEKERRENTERVEREQREAAARLEQQAREEAQRMERLRLELAERERAEQEERDRLALQERQRQEAERKAREELEERRRLQAEAKAHAEQEERERLEQLKQERKRLERLEQERCEQEERKRLEHLEHARREQEERERVKRLELLERERREQERREQDERERAERLEQERRELEEWLAREKKDREVREETARQEKAVAEQRQRAEAARLVQEAAERQQREDCQRREREARERQEQLEREEREREAREATEKKEREEREERSRKEREDREQREAREREQRGRQDREEQEERDRREREEKEQRETREREDRERRERQEEEQEERGRKVQQDREQHERAELEKERQEREASERQAPHRQRRSLEHQVHKARGSHELARNKNGPLVEDDVFGFRVAPANGSPRSKKLSEMQARILSLRKRLRALSIHSVARPSMAVVSSLPDEALVEKSNEEYQAVCDEVDQLPASSEDPTVDTELRSLRADVQAAAGLMTRVHRLAELATAAHLCDAALSDLLEHIDSYPAPPAGQLSSTFVSSMRLPPEEQLTSRLTFTEQLVANVASCLEAVNDDPRAVAEQSRILQTWSELEDMAKDRFRGRKSRPASVVSNVSGASGHSGHSAASTRSKMGGYSQLSVGSAKRGGLLAPLHPSTSSRRSVSSGTDDARKGSATKPSVSATSRSVSGPQVSTPTASSRLFSSTFASRQRTNSVTSNSSVATPNAVRPRRPSVTPIRPRAQTGQRSGSPSNFSESSLRTRSRMSASHSQTPQLSSAHSTWGRTPRLSFPTAPRSGTPQSRPLPLKRKTYVANPKNKLDVAVGDVVNKLPVSINVEVAEDSWKDQSGKYWIGDQEPKLCFCRILRSQTVMVRVGGGWMDLSKFIKGHFADLFRILPESPLRSTHIRDEKWISSATLLEKPEDDPQTPPAPPRTPEPKGSPSRIPVFALSTPTSKSPRSVKSTPSAPGSPLTALQFMRRADIDVETPGAIMRPTTPTRGSLAPRSRGSILHTPSRAPTWKP